MRMTSFEFTCASQMGRLRADGVSSDAGGTHSSSHVYYYTLPAIRQALLSPRMRGVIDREQTRGVDFGVALGGRQRGMAEQLLDRPQIAATGEEMRGERMAQRMRRRGSRAGRVAGAASASPVAPGAGRGACPWRRGRAGLRARRRSAGPRDNPGSPRRRWGAPARPVSCCPCRGCAATHPVSAHRGARG